MANDELNSMRAALAQSPDNVPLLKIFARLCLGEWALGEGKETYERILRLDPQDLDAQLGMVSVLYKMGKISEASVRVEAILQANPHNAQAHLESARLKISESDFVAAKEFYQRAVSLNPLTKDGAIEKQLTDAGLLSISVEPPPQVPALNTNEGWIAGEIEKQESDPVFDSLERPKISFADVGGMEQIKEEIRLKIIYPAQNPEIYKAYGKKAGGGVLLYGPPGCGKTLVSRATAGEIKANFISIGLHQILDMYIGNSEKNLHEIFELARHNTPSVLFIDEMDALAANRTDMRQSASRALINQFLAEMDGDINSNEGVLILGATNAPWYIDSAFRRPGRLDRIIFVPTPDEEARFQIINVLVKDKPIDKLDARALAKATKDFSGADLKAVFDLATEGTLLKAMRENRVIPITMSDLLKNAKTVVPSSRAWFDSAKNYALYSNQSGLYDPILAHLGIKK
jgi:transitional endoplasmic reticulum ATPase